MTIIKNGTGTDYSAKVTSANRLTTTTISETQADHASELGTRFNLNTGTIALTDANETALIYVKNTEDSDIFVTALIYNLGVGSHAGEITIDIIRNPTTGDIITNATDIDIKENQNHGSTRELSALAYKGATADGALTGGETSISTLGYVSTSGAQRIVVSLGAMIIPKGQSLAVKYTPPTGTTAQNVQVAVPCYVKTFET